MSFETVKVYPPDLNYPAAELHVVTKDGIEIPLRVSRETGELLVTIFDAAGATAWEFGLDDLQAALQRAAASLG